jgi:hypothetical protein
LILRTQSQLSESNLKVPTIKTIPGRHRLSSEQLSSMLL